jgi:very-short-patch-repair endonuclease
MLLTKEVEVKVNTYTIKYYESLGYKIPLRKASKSTFQHTGKEFCYDLNNTFMVKVDDLQKRSNVKVDAICDCCGETIYGLIYEHYCESMEMFGEYVCYKCKTVHYKKSCMQTYGVDNPSKLKEVHEKMKLTSLDRYGTEHPMQSLEIKEKAMQSCFDRYGCFNPSQSLVVRDKVAKTLYKNNTTPTSSQQLYIYNLYNIYDDVELNYPIKYYNADICFPEEKFIIEYDGGFHNGQVKLGRLTQEEFDQKEIIRNNIIKREGYKQMRIISSTDLLPSDEILLQMLQEAREYFAKYLNHSWIEYNIDDSIVRNAENKDGIHYNYGELRKIVKTA